MTYFTNQPRKRKKSFVVSKEETVKPRELYTRKAGRKGFSCVRHNKYFNGSRRYSWKGIDAAGEIKKVNRGQ